MNKSDEYAIELTEDGNWRLIVLEYSHPNMPDCKSVREVREADINNFDELRPWIEDINRIMTISVDEDHMLPVDIYLRHQVIVARKNNQTVIDAHKALVKAEHEVNNCKHWLEHAILDLTHGASK